MFNHLNPVKTIRIISLIAAIGGLISVLNPVLLSGNFSEAYYTWRMICAMAFQTVYLTFIDADILIWTFRTDTFSSGLNIADLLFYLLFLIGAILFSIDGFKKVRLLGFCFSVVFFVQCSGLILGVINFIRRYEALKQQNQVAWAIGFFAFNILWLFLSWYVLKTIAKHRAFVVEKFEEDGMQKAVFVSAEKGKRFVHLLVDRVMIILISSTWVWSLSTPIEIIEDRIGDRPTVTLIYILCLFIYYPFFETVLGATPAKFLTSTKVADEFGKRPGFGTILLRTVCRIIPFEAISFFGDRGWHDSLSRTYVLEEEVAVEEEASFSFEEREDRLATV